MTKDDLAALADQIDTDDQGLPLDDQWQVLADQLNTDDESSPSPAAGPAADVLQAVEEARRARDNAERELQELIRSAMLNRKTTKVRVKDLEQAADLSRARLYQIRDGRR